MSVLINPSSTGTIVINTTSITGGTSGRVLFDNAGVVGELANTGTGNNVLATSPTLTGSVGIGTETNPQTRLVVSANAATGIALPGAGPMIIVNADGSNSNLNLVTFNNGVATITSNITYATARGTGGTPAQTLASDQLALMACRGYRDTLVWGSIGARIQAFSSDNITATTNGMYWTIFTTPTGTSAAAEALRIQPSGGVSIGTTADAGIGSLLVAELFSNDATFLVRTKTTLTNAAAANIATITNGPAVGNPTKWFGIDDNGTTRFVPAW